MLKLELEKLDGLDDGVKGLYEEKDGKFRLKVDGLPDVGGLKAKNEELLGELKSERKKLKELSDAAEQARQDALNKSGDVSAVRTSYEEKLNKQKTDYDAQITALNGQLQGLTVGQTATSLAAELAIPGSAPVLMPHIRSRLGLEMRDGVATTVVLGKDGKPSAMTIEEFKSELRADPAFAPIIAGSKGSGGGAAGGGKGGGAAKTVTRAQFEAMSHSDRAKFSKEGGKVVG